MAISPNSTYVRDTSIEAYKDLIDRAVLGKKQAEVFEALIRANNQVGNVTAAELFDLKFSGKNLVLSNIRSRLAELRDAGAIEERAKRICQVSGKRAITWHFTGSKPQKVNRISKAERMRLVKEYMTVMLNQCNDRKMKSDLKVLWNMVKEL